MHRGDHARRVPETHREGPRSGTPVPTCVRGRAERGGHGLDPARPEGAVRGPPRSADQGRGARGDRKSTRLNSSHLVISYAVFCLKKKKYICPEYFTA